jgi:hypothetical protein
MRKMLTASASLLACALPIATLALPAHARTPNIILVAGEGMGTEFHAQIETAKRAIAAHDMTAAMQALDRAEAMAHGNPAMAPAMTQITQAKQMLTAGDMQGTNRALDALLSSDAMHIGNGG